MDQTAQYSSNSGLHPSRSHQLFQSPQLPPPSQLHLQNPAGASFSRPNTLPPIGNIPSPTDRFAAAAAVTGTPSPYQNHLIPTINTQQQSSSLPPLPSPSSGSQNSWPAIHRTSNSRDELHPSQQQQQQHSREHRVDPAVKNEAALNQPSMHHHDHSQAQPKDNGGGGGGAEDGMPSTSDFVKKLYKMLEDQSFQHVVSWGPQGDCFVVKDMNEFTKSILPRMFKHSNFASFVRQLNKYDFHKVKNTDDNQFGEHSWTFRHPDFHADRRDALENIKRKVPTQRKPAASNNSRTVSSTSPGPYPHPSSSGSSSAQVDRLQSQVDRLIAGQEEMSAHVRSLERNYQDVLVEMVGFQRNMAQQDGLMQNLIQYFLQVENGKLKASNGSAATNLNNNLTGGSSSSSISDQNPFLPTQVAQRMVGSYPESDVARASLMQMNEISRRAEMAGLSFGSESGGGGGEDNGNSERPPSRVWGSGLMSSLGMGMEDGKNSTTPVMSRQDALSRIEELQRTRPASAGGFTLYGPGTSDNAFSMSAGGNGSVVNGGVVNDGSTSPVIRRDSEEGTASPMSWNQSPDNTNSPGTHQGLQVYTVGHLMPRSNAEDDNGNWSFDPSSFGAFLPGLGIGLGGLMQNEGDASGSGSGSASGSGSGSGTGYAAPDLADSSAFGGEASTSTESVQPTPVSRPGSSQKLRVRRSTFVPGWAVPPRVLLVDDDAVSRKLSSKFLQVFGCTIDVAVDGVSAVNKMNLEKYDLVLMDIVMPKLDGVSATSLIRKFDHMTPIISMTSNSKPNEIMTYYSSGMNDILPKPFTKEGLLDMLEKHLMHLKVIQQMAKVPRSVGIPPLSDSSFENALTSQAALMNSNNSLQMQGGGTPGLGFGDDDGRINPLAGMGLSDEQYAMILQNLVNGESFPGVAGMGMGMGEGSSSGGEKRSLEDSSDGRDGKRSRFEVVE